VILHCTTNQDDKSRVLTTTCSSTTTVVTPPYTCTCTFAHTTSTCRDIQPIHSPLSFSKKILLSILGFLSSYAPYDGANPGHTRRLAYNKPSRALPLPRLLKCTPVHTTVKEMLTTEYTGGNLYFASNAVGHSLSKEGLHRRRLNAESIIL
jgi:hypothetical protein